MPNGVALFVRYDTLFHWWRLRGARLHNSQQGPSVRSTGGAAAAARCALCAVPAAERHCQDERRLP